MGTPGRVMIRADGKRGLLANGKAAVFSADGDCPECCGCPWCSGPTPETVTAILSSIVECPCAEWWKRKVTECASIGPNGTFDLSNIGTSSRCIYEYTTACDGEVSIYPDGDCSEDPESVKTIVSMTVRFTVSDPVSTLALFYTFDDDSGAYAFFRAMGFAGPGDCMALFTFEANTRQCTEFLAPGFFNSYWGAGSATVQA